MVQICTGTAAAAEPDQEECSGPPGAHFNGGGQSSAAQHWWPLCAPSGAAQQSAAQAVHGTHEGDPLHPGPLFAHGTSKFRGYHVVCITLNLWGTTASLVLEHLAPAQLPRVAHVQNACIKCHCSQALGEAL